MVLSASPAIKGSTQLRALRPQLHIPWSSRGQCCRFALPVADMQAHFHSSSSITKRLRRCPQGKSGCLASQFAFGSIREFCSHPWGRQGTDRSSAARSARAIACPGGLERSWEELERRQLQSCREEAPAQSTEDLLLTCTTFNVLAPIYKRLGNEEIRESSFREAWLPRNKKILSALLAKKSSIICLQELWLANPELVAMYEEGFHREGYKVLKLPRTNNRGDGLLTAVKTDRLEVVHHEDLLFHDSGDRVAQFLWLRSAPQACGRGEEKLEMLVVNTHLLFPHDSTSSFIRLRQVYKVLEHLEAYKAEHGLGPIPIVLCGDLNGTKQGQVSKFLRSQGFASSYDIAHEYPDTDQRWVSHRNHKGVVCGVDFIWLLNPSQQHSPLSADWKAAVFRFLRTKLSEIGYHDDREAFNFFCSASDEDPDFQDEEEEAKDRPYTAHDQPEWAGDDWGEDHKRHGVETTQAEVITMSDFETAVSQLGEEMGLTKVEVRELMDSFDVDSNGEVSYEAFQTVVSQLSDAPEVVEDEGDPQIPDSGLPKGGKNYECSEAVGFEVKDATLFPPETEEGFWPQDYALSDHSILTAVFLPCEPLRECFAPGCKAEDVCHC